MSWRSPREMVAPVVVALLLVLFWIAADIRRLKRTHAHELRCEGLRALARTPERRPPLPPTEAEMRWQEAPSLPAADEAERIICDEIHRVVDGREPGWIALSNEL